MRVPAASAVIGPLSLSQHLSFPPRSRLQDVAVSAILAQLSCDFLAMISRARADLAARDKMHVISISTTGLSLLSQADLQGAALTLSCHCVIRATSEKSELQICRVRMRIQNVTDNSVQKLEAVKVCLQLYAHHQIRCCVTRRAHFFGSKP